MKRIEAITKFLHSQPYDMCKLYTPEMEVQVNVAQDGGEIAKGTYAGIRWHGFTDGLTTWKHFRIPYNADREPVYEDKEIKFDLSKHVEAIGMTGWDWVNKKSRWVGFDFDSLIGHKAGLTELELNEIKEKLTNVDFITIYSSTGGSGLHLYVFISDSNNATISTHSDHAAVARAILAKISALTGIRLEAKVDTLGGNIWVWHRKATPGRSYERIHQAKIKCEIPLNWQEYINTVKRVIVKTDEPHIAANRSRIHLDEEHTRLINWFERSGSLWWYDDSKQMLVCHTYDLKRAYLELKLTGFFDTVSTGKNVGHDQNCFMFPLEGGAWIVRRHSKGTVEHKSWFLDKGGWTTTYYNRLPSFMTAAQINDALEDEKGYYFRRVSDAINTLKVMGIDCELPNIKDIDRRSATISFARDEKLKISFDALDSDIDQPNWIKKKSQWTRYFFRPRVVDEIELPDDTLRHLTSLGVNLGWTIFTNNNWIQEGRHDIVVGLKAKGYKILDIEPLMGNCVLNNWRLVNRPFQPEYPGNREWNKDAAQLKYTPNRGPHPTWDLILNHCGANLTNALIKKEFFVSNGIINGLLYLQLWFAALFQYPTEPLPYLFLYGSQNCGKSILHEVASLLLTKGYQRADNALVNANGFNGELANAILCVVEEVDLSKKSTASDRIKDWVTGRTIAIHAKTKQPYDIVNTTHWIQCANNISYCPVFPGDTRITFINVPTIKTEIPKHKLLEKCIEEAAAFLYTILNFELPEPISRLRIPVVETQEKYDQMRSNRTPLQAFIDEEVQKVDGQKVLFADFYNRFQQFLEPAERAEWTNRRVSKELPLLKGKAGGDGQLYIGNISFNKEAQSNGRLIKEGERLVEAASL